MEPQADSTPSLLGDAGPGVRRRGGDARDREAAATPATTTSRIPVPSLTSGESRRGHGGGGGGGDGGAAQQRKGNAAGAGASGGGGSRHRDRQGGAADADHAPRRSSGGGAGAIIGAGAAGSGVLLALLTGLAVSFLWRLARAPSPGGHMTDHSIPLAWPGHVAVQAAAAAARSASRRLVPAPQVVAGDAFAFGLTAMLYAACRLGLADAVGAHPGGVALPDLAVATRAHDATLGRLVRALAQHGYFSLSGGGGVVTHTHLSALLRSDHPNAMCPLVGHNVEDAWQAWARLPDALADEGLDTFAATRGGGSDIWAYYDAHPGARRQFERTMAAADSASWYGLVHDYRWGQHSRVVDVGGSTGSLLHRILTAAYRSAAEGGGGRPPAPAAGVLFDRPPVIAEAHKMWDLRAAAAEATAAAAAGGARAGGGKKKATKRGTDTTAAAAAALAAEVERNATLAVDFVPGDFLKPAELLEGGGLPHGRDGDVFVLRTVLHDWPDETAVAILSNVRRAMGGGGGGDAGHAGKGAGKPPRMTLAVIEQVVAETGDSGAAVDPPLRGLLDLQMRLLTRGGRERSAREWAALLRRGGFTLTRIHATRSLLSVIEAAPASDAAPTS